MIINNREIGAGQPPYIIAEISCNHCGDFDKAIELIDTAKYAGADCVKFQSYTADSITLDCDKPDFIIKDGPWKGRRLYELYTVAQTPREWFQRLFDYAKKRSITPISSVFSREEVDFLEGLDCPAYKIASMEIIDLPLIRYAAKTGKPVIISTGMATDEEVRQACVRSNMAFLHCISGYPTAIKEANLHRLEWLEKFALPVGISDHTLGWEMPVAATALGASIIEKHLCMSRSDPTEDAAFSLEPEEFKTMVEKVRDIWHAMQPSEAKSQESSRQLRRSLYVVKDVKAGEAFTDQNMRSIRPAYGLAPKHYEEVIGRAAICDIDTGMALAWNLIK